jgi:hypothetical protein
MSMEGYGGNVHGKRGSETTGQSEASVGDIDGTLNGLTAMPNEAFFSRVGPATVWRSFYHPTTASTALSSS